MPGHFRVARRVCRLMTRAGRPTSADRDVVSLVAADAFVGELTRGSIRTFPATAETENTASYQGGLWLTIQSTAKRSLKPDSLLTGKRTGNFVKIGPFGKKWQKAARQNVAKSVS